MSAPFLGLYSVGSGSTRTIDVHASIRFTLVPDSGATATYSKIDSLRSAAHDSRTSLTATTVTSIDVDWPFYLVTSSGGTTRIGIV